MTNVLSNPQVVQSFQLMIGHYVWKIIISILIAIPSFTIIDTIKKWISLKIQRADLINSSLISIDGYFELGGGKKGFVKSIGQKWIRLENPAPDFTVHNVSIEQVLANPITKLHYNNGPSTELALASETTMSSESIKIEEKKEDKKV